MYVFEYIDCKSSYATGTAISTVGVAKVNFFNVVQHTIQSSEFRVQSSEFRVSQWVGQHVIREVECFM